MSIKAWLIGGTALFGTVGTAVIANDVGNFIEIRANTQAAAHRQRLKWEDKQAYLENEIDEALIDDKVATYEVFYYTIRWTTPIVLVAVCSTGLWLFRGWAVAQDKKVQFEATQIRLDPVTRTYPIICFEAAGKLRMHDPNTKMTASLEMDHDAVPLLVANNTAVQLQSMARADQEVSLPMLMDFASNYLETQKG